MSDSGSSFIASKWTHVMTSLIDYLPILPFLGGAMLLRGFPVEESSCQCRRHGLIPGSGRSPGRQHDNLLQYSCLENPMDRGASQSTVCRITNSQTQLKQLGTHTCSPALSFYLYCKWDLSFPQKMERMIKFLCSTCFLLSPPFPEGTAHQIDDYLTPFVFP